MFQSKSFELEKRKRSKAKRCKNPGRHLSKLLVLLVLTGFVSWFILANIPEGKKVNTAVRLFQECGAKNELRNNEVCILDKCDVICDSGSIDDVLDFMRAPPSVLCLHALTLTLLNVTFHDSALKRNWLTGTFTLAGLYIRNSELKGIEEDAFEGSVYQQLSHLEISFSSIDYLKKGSFAHLTSLTDLTLDHSVKEFSPEYLDGIENNIKQIEIHGVSDLHSPNELFGILPLPKLITLELGNNNFGDTINESTFQNVTPKYYLNLTDCKISSLHPRTFAVAQKGPTDLYLENNYLKEVSGEVFEPIIERDSHSKIKLSGNPWNCTCRLLSLVNLIEENKRVFVDSPKCASPPEFAGKELHPDIFIIPSTTTTTEGPTLPTVNTTKTTTTTTKIPVSTSTKHPDETSLTEIVCEDDVEDICVPGSADARSILYVKEMDMKFNISKVSSGVVRISMEKPAKEFSIVWFTPAAKDFNKVQNHYTEHNLGCAELEMQNFTIQDLELGALYVFCIVKGNDPEMTPLNCQSHLVEVDCNEADFLDSEGKTALLLLSIISILVAVFLGGVTMFCIIRCNPTLLKGAKRIVILNKNLAEVVVLPKRKSKSEEVLKTNSLKRNASGRRLSTSSRESNRDYIIPDYEVISNRPQRKDNLYFEWFPIHSPPPLPKRLSEETIETLSMQSDKLEFVNKSNNEYAVPNSRV
ncbi:unnamed protein product [Hermetia illucens]|uniref:LRRCT domain-containing protein n=1 Tax=Hermetia illucens TaxID=343691 RepID=A0A7R8YPI3_HERIL|nr:uncharacterized protein LOC119661470 [Hermetia illucens]CAD7077426.1 unnamed protein product [Hermetia illucens]